MKPQRLRGRCPAGLTTAFALLPECIAFALVAHLNPLMGLYGAFIICTLTALLGGRPGMISGAAGSMAVVIVALVVQHGVQYLLATVLLGGLIMLALRPVAPGQAGTHGAAPGDARLRQWPGNHHCPGPAGTFQERRNLAERHAAVPDDRAGAADHGHCLSIATPDPNRPPPRRWVAILGVGLAVYLLDLPTRTLGDMAHIAGGLRCWPCRNCHGTLKPCGSSPPMHS